MTSEAQFISDQDRVALLRESIHVLSAERHRGRLNVFVTSPDEDRARAAVRACLGDAVTVYVCGDVPRVVRPMPCEGYMEREAGRLQLRYVNRGDQHIDHIFVAEDDETVVVYGMSCISPLGASGDEVDSPYHEYLKQPLGDRTVIDGVTGEPVPYRNVYEGLAKKWGLNGN
jgi:hypothetical protein